MKPSRMNGYATARQNGWMSANDIRELENLDRIPAELEACKGEGLPISCIANLCYLPEYVNRSKKDKNFYQDKKYLQYVKLEEVEAKYSFTEEEDLDWMDMSYEKLEDFAVLKEYYTDYCTKRFGKIKHLFCDALGITYEEIEESQEEVITVVSPEVKTTENKKVKFADKCVVRLAQEVGSELIKMGRSTYMTSDGKK